MDRKQILRGLEDSIATWNMEDSRRYAEAAMAEGIDPETAINDGLAKGMDRISKDFDEAKIFLPQILMASKAMEAALDIIEPHMMGDAKLKGVIVMGSVKGDVHSIGKNVCCAMLRGAGFRVVDAGTDVDPDTFVRIAKEVGADIVGGSALMTVSLPQQKEMVRIFKEDGLSVMTIFGGAPCSQEWVNEIGGSGYSASGGEIVKLVRNLLHEERSERRAQEIPHIVRGECAALQGRVRGAPFLSLSVERPEAPVPIGRRVALAGVEDVEGPLVRPPAHDAHDEVAHHLPYGVGGFLHHLIHYLQGFQTAPVAVERRRGAFSIRYPDAYAVAHRAPPLPVMFRPMRSDGEGTIVDNDIAMDFGVRTSGSVDRGDGGMADGTHRTPMIRSELI